MIFLLLAVFPATHSVTVRNPDFDPGSKSGGGFFRSRYPYRSETQVDFSTTALRGIAAAAVTAALYCAAGTATRPKKEAVLPKKKDEN